ncbi:prostaglandin G/H synthase 2 isoform X2 [Latimeria chalumnae]|uniref:Prostaglandin G/H synthase 2 n=1 Tax=Latimeria chalumnae TaxID=7897 RepID=M3XGW9_LATCH|nr:PREDICTED: prostaglandin G/H synthase 2 isoform X2 [Latimeria chalumnae]|eukprot:XP_006009312.1 PREDICTED: prostaglandin G/H synthase 2 isoform X2 [Latimeria chalumnae]
MMTKLKVEGRQRLSTNPCCSNPCQNRGVCMTVGFDNYECDCTRTGFYGKNCTTPEFWTWVKRALKPSPNTVHYILTHYKGFWNIVNSIPFLRDAIMRYVLTSRSHLIDSPPTYNSHYDYKSWEAYSNLSYYTRTLPPVPEDCPTPMGVKGKNSLPDSKMIAEKFLLRRKFIPDPQGTSLMFAFFAQHFTHQFFKTDQIRGPAFTTGLGHGVDLNHIYGETLDRQHKLRLFKDGKLKYQMINGEMYPPTVKDVQVAMTYPPHIAEDFKFAVGQEVFGLVPGLMMYSVIWLREHNRVCDILKQEHPEWDDERLFQTTRLILIGETIKIVIEDYVQHLSGYHFKLKFDPELLFHQQFQYQNRIAAEFNTLYHWHPLMPDSFLIQGKEYGYHQFLFNNSIVTEHGIRNLVESFSKQIAGRVAGGRNVAPGVLRVAIASIDQSRKMRYQSLNEYRKRFQMRPYKSFEDLTGEKEMAAELQELYGDVDAVELYPGLMVEKPRPGAIFGETMVEMGAPFSLKGLIGNPICSPEYWKPSTFGGNVGFQIVNTASLQKLVCSNVKGTCPFTSFHIPEPNPTKTSTSNASTSNSALKDINPSLLLKKHSTEL